MIRINLLPDEYRRSERTSPRVFGALLLAVVAVCCSVGWFGLVYFGELGELRSKHVAATERLANLTDRVAYCTALSGEKTDFQERAKTIDQINGSRVLWTEVLDQLIDTVNNDGEIDRHFAWFSKIAVKDGGKGAGPIMSLPAEMQGGDIRRLADFHEDIEHAPFFAFVTAKKMPASKLNISKQKKPPESLAFPLHLGFKPAQEWQAIRATMAKAELPESK